MVNGKLSKWNSLSFLLLSFSIITLLLYYFLPTFSPLVFLFW